MPVIDIPDNYWDVEPAGCVALVQTFEQAFADAHGVIVDAQAVLTGAAAEDATQALADVDGAGAPIVDALAAENELAYATRTNDVLEGYGAADQLHATADASVPRVDYQAPGYTVTDPPEVDENLFDGIDGTKTQDTFVRHPPDKTTQHTTETTTTTTTTAPHLTAGDVALADAEAYAQQKLGRPLTDAEVATEAGKWGTGPYTDAQLAGIAADIDALAPAVAVVEQVPQPAAEPDVHTTPLTVGDFVDALNAIDWTIHLQV
ncbi:MAG: hypothetical protein LAO77_23185 [Acidobacteriia bacterium]|nr:hypothetical protein [Terriglobia bacterium]